MKFERQNGGLANASALLRHTHTHTTHIASFSMAFCAHTIIMSIVLSVLLFSSFLFYHLQLASNRRDCTTILVHQNEFDFHVFIMQFCYMHSNDDRIMSVCVCLCLPSVMNAYEFSRISDWFGRAVSTTKHTVIMILCVCVCVSVGTCGLRN